MRTYTWRIMAGYSGTPLTKKLGIVEGTGVALVGAPVGFGATLGPLPAGAHIVEGDEPASVVVLFAVTYEELEERFARARVRIPPAGGIWVAWPKKASSVETELSFDVVQAHGLAMGLVDNKVCAVDDTWSGLRFVIRTKDRS